MINCWLACPEHCTSCEGNKCYGCEPNYKLFDNKCYLCTDFFTNCERCVSITDSYYIHCGVCNDTYRFGLSESCTERCSSECLNNECSSDGKCFDCASGYIFNSNRVCVLPAMAGCSVVSNGKCGKCYSGYVNVAGYCYSKVTCYPSLNVKISDNVCISFGDAHCQWGISDGNCYGCEYGYTKVNNYCLPLEDVFTTCKASKVLYQSTVCSVCEDGYYPEGANCVSCSTIPGCSKCESKTALKESSAKLCTECSSGYLEDGQCKTIANCQKYEGKTCSLCFNNYILYNNACVSASSMNCSSSSNNVCQECISRFYLDDNHRCQSCSKYNTDGTCLECNSTQCSHCSSGMTIKQGKCFRCEGNVGNCYECDPTSDKCNICKRGYFKTSDTSLCDVCPSQCTACSSLTQCSECSVGYYLSQQTCLECAAIDGCQSQKCTVDGRCTQCLNNSYILENGKCTKCSSKYVNCYQCNSTQCTNCLSGYYPSTKTYCQNCNNLRGCSQCSQTLAACTQCSDNYYLVGGICKTCSEIDSNCAVCSVTTSKCQRCKDGYTLVNNLCVVCSLEIPNCQTCSTTSKECVACANNQFYLNNKLCSSCSEAIINCTTCSNSNTCTACDSSKNVFLNANNRCESCESINNCLTCSSDGKCTKCISNGYRLVGGVCVSCNEEGEFEGCNTCNPSSSSICLSCREGYYLYSSQCLQCSGNCSSCSSLSCTVCEPHFLNNNGVCESCPSKGCATCSQENEDCSECLYGYNLVDNRCIGCTSVEYCKVCSLDQCSECNKGYHLTEAQGCSVCSDNCIDCGTQSTNGICSLCKTGYYLNSQNECSKCADHCSDCSSTKCSQCQNGYTINTATTCGACPEVLIGCSLCGVSNKVCLECNNGYYLSNGVCNPCEDLECEKCSAQNHCVSCKGNYISQNGECIECPEGTTKKTGENQCISCGEISNCLTCNSLTNCTFCNPGFYITNNGLECTECNGLVIPPDQCITGPSDCLKFSSEVNCLKCKEEFVLRNGGCTQYSNSEYCLGKDGSDGVGCTDCSSSISVSGICHVFARTIYKSFYDEKTQQEMGYYPGSQIQNSKGVDPTCIYENKGKCWKCGDGSYMNQEQIPSCSLCDSSCGLCTQTATTCINCSTTTSATMTGDIIDSTCSPDGHCLIFQGTTCFKCENKYYLNKNKCSPCNQNCETCVLTEDSKTKCLVCSPNHYKLADGSCVTVDDNCEIRSETSLCLRCVSGKTLNSNGECIPISEKNCSYIVSGVCQQCSNNNLVRDELAHWVCDNAKEFENCHSQNEVGCLRCERGKFFDENNLCSVCDINCKTCFNTRTNCTSCNFGHKMTQDNTCVSLGSLSERCQIFFPDSSGCAICREGYYQYKKDCISCDESCGSCVKQATECVTCNTTGGYFYDIEHSKCVHNSTLEYCVLSGTEGCLSCSNGTYLSSVFKKCYLCDNNCLDCVDSPSKCSSCQEEYILSDYSKGKCTHFTNVTHCLESKDSKCVSCDGWYEPSSEGTECLYAPNYWIVIGIPVVGFIVIVITTILIVVLIIFFIHSRKQQKEREEKICEFEMSRSNIQFVGTDKESGLCYNKSTLNFTIDRATEIIPVGEESRDLLCVGNTKSKTLKVQISTKENTEKYQIRTDPSLITIDKGKAVEFSIFIKPLCTTTVNDSLVILALDMKKGKQYEGHITIMFKTESTTKIDPDELKEDKKLGEGSFGIVYLGTFRGNKVAIKKMKSSLDNEKQMREFTEEVTMLDKFRSEYIIHFYGAVFIPNKICMVTEFAQFGSLQDLIQKKPRINNSLIARSLFNCAKGIQYLHTNGILHRDIKPDNLLIVSLDEKTDIIAKLTDFGASRNVNLMMTNMTFTKGIGTPMYMAPEVLRKSKYKLPADIYSFGITMYETSIWGNPFPKDRFKFPWEIADFISEGKKLEKIDIIDDWLFDIIEKCWCFNPKERINANEIVDIFMEHLK